MNRTTRGVLIGYGAFAVVNFGVAYLTSPARTGRQPGQNRLLDINDALTKLNPLAYFLPVAGIPVPAMQSQVITPLPAPQVTTTPTGTTTYFGP